MARRVLRPGLGAHIRCGDAVKPDGLIAELQRVTPVEIFRDPKGKAVAAGHYSALVRVVFQSSERTLTDEELGRWS